MTLDEVRRKAVLEALARHRGNKRRTAGELGVSLKTLYNLLNRWVTEGRVTRAWVDSLAHDESDRINAATAATTTTTEGTRDDGNDH